MAADVIVVGTGPAGGAAAYHLARGGAKVLLLEARVLPRSKLCSGVLTAYSEREALRMINLAQLDAVTLGTSTRTCVYTGAGRPSFLAAHHCLRFVDRRAFDFALVQAAATLGAKVYDGRKVTRVFKHREGRWRVTILDVASGRIEEVTAAHIVGADGSESLLAKGVQRDARYALALEASVPYAGDNVSIVDWSADGGYFWLFPKHDGTAGVGGGTVSTAHWRTFPEQVRDFWSLQGIELPSRMPGHRLRYVRTGPVAREGLLLAGEAAGAVDPALGEGIRSALISGRLAAHAILGGGDVSRRYTVHFCLHLRQFLWRRELYAHAPTAILGIPGLGAATLRYFLG